MFSRRGCSGPRHSLTAPLRISERQIAILDHDAVGEGANLPVARTGIDGVARLEAPYARADLGDGAREIMAKDERRLIGQDRLELTVPDLGVEQIEARRLHLDHH